MKDKLITKNYIEILAANFLLFFGFWLLMPVLPFYLAEVFDANKTTIGAVLSCYTIAALCIRPFSGYLLDTFARKPLYLLAYFTFTAIFGGYLIAGTLTLFILFRIIHGVSFGMVTVSGNTIVIDIMPSSRRGEGLGYYGLANNIAMSIGPMTGLFLHDAGADYTLIFCCSLGSCLIGFLCASLVKTTYKPPVKREPISLDRFIDIMPSSRRGEGLGYYGLANNIAMSIGPMTGLFLHDAGADYTLIFCCSLGSCLIGFLCASLVKTTYKPPVKREPISLDRFILLKGIPAGFSLLLLSIPYGMTTNYVAMYAKQIGIQSSTGFFFTFMALGMAVSRLFSGRLVDRGMVTQVIEAGLYLVCFCFFGLSSCGWLTTWSLQWTTYFLFTIALLLGIGFGTMFPAYNTLFVNLAPNNQRGTATSTYLTSWDVGIGAGMLLGGYIAEIATFKMAYLFGAALTVISLFYFRSKVAPHFHRHKLR